MNATEKNRAETVNGRTANGRFASGNSGGPGRPPRELSITEALRNRATDAVRSGERTHVEELARLAWEMATDASASPRDRLAAMTFIADRIEGKARQTIAIPIDAPALPHVPDLSRLSASAQSELLTLLGDAE